VRWFQTGGNDYVATGSWDKTVKFWDLKGAEPVGTLDARERVYSMDVKDQLLVVATAERHIHMINLQDPTKIYKSITSPLKWQTRVVSCFSDATGFAVGSIEGRCAIQYVEDKDTRYVAPPTPNPKPKSYSSAPSLSSKSPSKTNPISML
jgi:mRNA export factor